MKAPLICVLALILCVSSVSAQGSENNWTRLESDSKDFSVAVPSRYQAIADEEGYQVYERTTDGFPAVVSAHLGKILMVTASRGGASILIERYRCRKVKEALDILLESRFSAREFSRISLKEFVGGLAGARVRGNYLFEMLVGNENTIYRIIVGARNADNETLKYLLSSIRLNGSRIFANKTSLDSKVIEVSKAISDLQETPFQFEPPDKPDKLPPKTIFVQETGDLDNTQLAILYKAPAKFTEKARYKDAQGTVQLLVTFGAGGEIEKIKVISGVGSGLTEQCVRAARLIRFLPPEKDGVPVTTEAVMEYSFRIVDAGR
jgi:TonB family protein